MSLSNRGAARLGAGCVGMTILGCGGSVFERSIGVFDAGVSPNVSNSSVDAARAVDARDEALADTSDGGGALTGRVVSWYTLRPLSGRKITVGGQSTSTDANGSFVLHDVTGRYDAAVADPDGATVSVYRSLSRRDPILLHPGASGLVHSARVGGDVSGGGGYPLGPGDVVFVNFFSPDADQSWPLGGGLSTLQLGPGYGPMPLRWDGSGSISGELVAFGVFQEADGGHSSWFVHRPLTLTDGQTAFANLGFSHASPTGHISGSIELPANSRIVQKDVFYRLPILNARIGVPAVQTDGFDDEVPNFGELGAELCVGAVAIPGSAFTARCGISPTETGFTLTLQAPPSLSSPVEGATVDKVTPFSWTSFGGGVHVLQLDAIPSSTATPRIYLFTSETSTLWPDLTSAGIAFPAGASYQCTIGGLGPYVSMDDATGPNGLGAPFPAEVRRSFSPTIHVMTTR